MAAGSGGIRWNSVTKKIQLMDENKNWIDWQFYDQNTTMLQIGNYTDSGIKSATLAKGTYLLFGSTYSSGASIITNISTTATNKLLAGSNIAAAYLFEAESNNTNLSFNVNVSYSGSVHLFKIGVGLYSFINLDSYTIGGNDSGTYSKSYTDSIKLVFGCVNSGAPIYYLANFSDVNKNMSYSYLSTYYGYGIASNFDMAGSASITVRGNQNNGSASITGILGINNL